MRDRFAPARVVTAAASSGAPRSHTARLLDAGYPTAAAAAVTGGPARGVLGPRPALLTEPVTDLPADLPGALASGSPGGPPRTARHTPPARGRRAQPAGWAR